MASGTELALYGTAGLLVTEATGVTNFTEIAGSGDDVEDKIFAGGPSPGIPPGIAEAFGNMAGAFQGVSENAMDSVGLAEAIVGGMNEQSQQFIETMNEQSPGVDDVTPGGGQQSPLWSLMNGGGGGTGFDGFDFGLPGGGGGGGGSGGSGGGGGGYGAPTVWELLTTQEARGGLPSPGAWIGNVPGRVTGPIFESAEGAMDAGAAAWENDKQRLKWAENQVSGMDAGAAVNLATPFNTQGLPDIPSPVGTAEAAESSEQPIRNDGGADPSGGTPTPSAIERRAKQYREEKTKREQRTQESGSTGARLV